jgi:hypothetical protein
MQTVYFSGSVNICLPFSPTRSQKMMTDEEHVHFPWSPYLILESKVRIELTFVRVITTFEYFSLPQDVVKFGY